MADLQTTNGREAWASRLGLILAMAGNAIGLGNFLRFPVQAAQTGHPNVVDDRAKSCRYSILVGRAADDGRIDGCRHLASHACLQERNDPAKL